jgi:hypothetical protein
MQCWCFSIAPLLYALIAKVAVESNVMPIGEIRRLLVLPPSNFYRGANTAVALGRMAYGIGPRWSLHSLVGWRRFGKHPIEAVVAPLKFLPVPEQHRPKSRLQQTSVDFNLMAGYLTSRSISVETQVLAAIQGARLSTCRYWPLLTRARYLPSAFRHGLQLQIKAFGSPDIRCSA